MPEFLSAAAVLLTFALCAYVGSRLTERLEANMIDEDRAILQTW